MLFEWKMSQAVVSRLILRGNMSLVQDALREQKIAGHGGMAESWHHFVYHFECSISR